MQAMLDRFSVIVDASGSTTANRLSCPGAEHAIEAAAIYNRYNRILSGPEGMDDVSDWHGPMNRFNRATVVVGGGISMANMFAAKNVHIAAKNEPARRSPDLVMMIAGVAPRARRARAARVCLFRVRAWDPDAIRAARS